MSDYLSQSSAAERHQALFERISDLVLCHSPSGVEAEVDQYLKALWPSARVDNAGNLVLHIPGRDSRCALAITAHKDEIGALVDHIEPNGRIQVRRLGGAYPWIYGEGAVDILGDQATYTGVLSFGSRHVSHESPQKAQQDTLPVRWEDAWIETCQTPGALAAMGIRPGTRVVVGKHRKQPLRLTPDVIASYTLDNKASLAILLELAEQLRLTPPALDVYLVASAKEEVGALGALYFCQQFNQHYARNQHLQALIALEICPVAPEYPIQFSAAPVLLAQDGYGLYDDHLTQALVQAAQAATLPVQHAIIRGFGSDASIAMKMGHVGRGACLAFPTQNTHGYEIAYLGAIAACTDILMQFCQTYIGSDA